MESGWYFLPSQLNDEMYSDLLESTFPSYRDERIVLVQAVTAIDTVSDFPLTPQPRFGVCVWKNSRK
jgi:hypothetical protein